MKKLIILSTVLLTACYSDTIVGTTKPCCQTQEDVFNTLSNALSVVSAPASPVTNGPFSITVNVTPGATYSFQLTHINGSILHNKGFTATAAQMTVTMDYSNVVNGAYDLNLMDNTGRLLKVPVIVQK